MTGEVRQNPRVQRLKETKQEYLKPPSTLELYRADLVLKVWTEFRAILLMGANHGARLDHWLIQHPDSIIARTAEMNKPEVCRILSRIKGGENRWQTFEILMIHENLQSENSIKSPWLRVKKWNENRRGA